MHASAARQVGKRPAQLFGMKRQLLAYREWRRAVIDAESKKRHAMSVG
jgi:hypothetical protein